ncbi:PilZ domain-containing protein [Atopomonas sediminilitoris]|uniref:PilZ domain-containing protein n=1 Tax=Atopomonas sediminilitoris TaxID=2919919 RepID=UPI001F4E3AB1|nr:PilZ domain-containing protein [Atopomonas sediminilitoris]MCJ8167802.1 PilZ domain-containing protein [Atopomonas sediminilitoris]
MRQYIRHPSCMPVELHIAQQPSQQQPLHDISLGGVACHCEQPAPVGSTIDMHIPLPQGDTLHHGVVAWCKADADGYLIGISFKDQDSFFHIRMIEQVCAIEAYRRTLEKVLGRRISGEEAAQRWIQENAADFPQMSAQTMH